MKPSSIIIWSAAVFVLLTAGQTVLANPCGELIYNKHGKLRKYSYNNHTISENIKEHGVISGSASSSWSTSTEGTTGASDPGVTTGEYLSLKQSTSTQGECKWLGLALNTDEKKSEYIAQNMTEIKDDMAKGSGGHLDVLASAYGCSDKNHEAFNQIMQKNFDKFVDYNEEKSKEFTSTLNNVVKKELSATCVASSI